MPVISAPQDEILVNNGETAILRCDARGIPPPVISWYKGEEEVSLRLVGLCWWKDKSFVIWWGK